eukprot:TRINITY_DN3103_c0_g1_i1.p1 TRINITY_DN3103_c0_g1~~TRINITY_DN3103_c0_g1_i1.p1  ORF type:complete len:550 (+),score=98.54 TRINITY_DN3103_c0_g1_i1:63-1712(+)
MSIMRSPSFRAVLATLALACTVLWTPVGASFLKKHNRSHTAVGADVSADLLGEIEKVLGSDHREATERRLAPMETLLKPTLNAMAKNELDRYSHEAVKYAIHRLFIKRHGWYINEESGEGDKQASFATTIFSDRLPEYVQGLFEARMGSMGLSAHEVALLAATIENLVHREVESRLVKAYSLAKFSTNSSLDTAQTDGVLDSYIALYLDESDPQIADQQQLFESLKEDLPLWEEIRAFIREVREDRVGDNSLLDFAGVADVVERIADRYGRFQNKDCHVLKSSLLGIHNDGSGTIPLPKFYAAALAGQWQFSESLEYLRYLGALEEPSDGHPRVLVSNYVLSESNCVGTSSFYRQCCINECEDLLEHLEIDIKAPAATPERIVELVAHLPSSTTKANRTLRPKLLERLRDMASESDGLVNLHSRMFAQWLHHAYPRECPFPRVPGAQASATTDMVASDQYMQEVAGSLNASDRASDLNSEAEASLWVDVEVHYTGERPQVRASSRGVSAIFRAVLFLGAFISLARILSTHFKTLAPVFGECGDEKLKWV